MTIAVPVIVVYSYNKLTPYGADAASGHWSTRLPVATSRSLSQQPLELDKTPRTRYSRPHTCRGAANVYIDLRPLQTSTDSSVGAEGTLCLPPLGS